MAIKQSLAAGTIAMAKQTLIEANKPSAKLDHNNKVVTVVDYLQQEGYGEITYPDGKLHVDGHQINDSHPIAQFAAELFNEPSAAQVYGLVGQASRMHNERLGKIKPSPLANDS